MEILGGLVTLLNLGLAAVIGIRLARRVWRNGGVERGLAAYFLLHSFLGAGLSCGLYVGWADPEMAVPAAVEVPLHLGFQILATLGVIGAYAFTWKTFRPDSAVARGVVGFAAGAMVGSLIALGATEGFAIRVLNGPAYWVHFAIKIGFLPWIAVESFRHWGLQRRRLALGLADPMVANRFLLWGLWSTAVFGMGFADPIARFWYVSITGSTTVWMPEHGVSIVNATVAYSSALGLAAATLLFLTFFPTEAYRRWVCGASTEAAASA